MRIRELLEAKDFNDLDFVKKDGDKTDIDYDLVEDLVFFMNNDDETYRRHVYPVVAKCTRSIELNKSTSPSIFKNAVLDSYKSYTKEYPIRELPDTLDSDVCQEVCSKMHEEVCKTIEENDKD
jgi:hypothetical protein